MLMLFRNMDLSIWYIQYRYINDIHIIVHMNMNAITILFLNIYIYKWFFTRCFPKQGTLKSWIRPDHTTRWIRYIPWTNSKYIPHSLSLSLILKDCFISLNQPTSVIYLSWIHLYGQTPQFQRCSMMIRHCAYSCWMIYHFWRVKWPFSSMFTRFMMNSSLVDR